jgi:hypothetical protein
MHSTVEDSSNFRLWQSVEAVLTKPGFMLIFSEFLNANLFIEILLINLQGIFLDHAKIIYFV